MNQGIVFRLAAFFATVGLLVGLVGFTAHTAWRRTGVLHDRLSETQWKSFQLADHLQQATLGLNNLVLRYAASRDVADWTNFAVASKEIARWLDDQGAALKLPKERPFLARIKIAYQDYLTTATALNTRIYGSRESAIRLAEFTDLEKKSKRILNLGSELAATHQQAIDQLQAQNIRSLDVLRFELLGALAVLLVIICWLAVVVYRDMIAPLQVQLVESRQLVERQEKLASLGMLAAGVAHEIRNPLTAIKAWLFMQQKHLDTRHAGICRRRTHRRRDQPAGAHRQGFSPVRPPVRTATRRRPGRTAIARSANADATRAGKIQHQTRARRSRAGAHPH